MEFPTLAEKTLLTAPHNLAIAARRAGAFTEKSFSGMEYIFPDESIIVVTGRGKSYKAEAILP